MPAQIGVDRLAELVDRAPLQLAVRQGDARRFPDAPHRHVVLEGRLARVERAADRRRRRRLGRARERDVAFAGVEAGRRVEADPAGAGEKDFAPGVQVGEVDLGAARAVERLDVALQLDQVARDEARRQAEMTQELHQQPRAVAARAARVLQRQLGRLHAVLHADQVGDVLLQPLVELHQEGARRLLAAVDAIEVGLEQRRRRRLAQVGRELDQQLGLVGEGKLLRARLEEEIERVEDRHLGDEVDLDAEERRRLREDEPGEVVRLRVLLPVDEVLGRLDLHRVAQDAGSRVRRRPQPDDLRAEVDRPVVAVVRDVVEGDVDRHSGFPEGNADCRPQRIRARPGRGSRD